MKLSELTIEQLEARLARTQKALNKKRREKVLAEEAFLPRTPNFSEILETVRKDGPALFNRMHNETIEGEEENPYPEAVIVMADDVLDDVLDEFVSQPVTLHPQERVRIIQTILNSDEVLKYWYGNPSDKNLIRQVLGLTKLD